MHGRLKRCFLIVFLAGLLWLQPNQPIFSAYEDLDTRPPNVIVFLSDDQGWGDFGFQGNDNFRTPNLDLLAQTGAVCSRFYVCPVCAPTRAEFLTGRYHPRGSVMGVTQGEERLDLDELTLADRLRQHGYRTGIFGKWHNGSQYPYHPNGRGFEEFYGFCSGHWGDYFSPPLEHNGQKVRGNGFVTDDFTDHAIAFMESHHREPFFCFVAYNTPHSPMQVPGSFMDKVNDRTLTKFYEPRSNEREDAGMTRAVIAMVENIDWNVGRILESLKRLKIDQETIVIYFNDNGPNSFRWNGGMKGKKGSVDEGGVRTPLIVNWPGHIPAGSVVHQLAGAIDLTPTICDLSQIPIDRNPTKPLDGISLAEQLLHPSLGLVDRSLFSEWSGLVAMRQGKYLLDAQGDLFDLLEDPGQNRPITQREPELVNQMKSSVGTWRNEVLLSAESRRPFLIGHPDRSIAELPAQDGKCQGPFVRRSDTAPNCSYFTRIRSPEDVLEWDVEALQPGRYRIVVNYTAPQEAVGASLGIAFGDREISGVIPSAFTCVPRGEENDRYPRKSESFLKDFGSFELGSLDLQPNRSSFKVRLKNGLPGDSFIEIQGIEVRLEK